MVSTWINSDDFSLNQMESINKTLVFVAENENQKNARELHDNLGQQLIVLKYLFDVYSKEKSKNHDLEFEIKKSINALTTCLKSLIDKCVLPNCNEKKLTRFLPTMSESINKLNSNYFHFYFGDSESRKVFSKLSTEINLNLIRIIQEFTSNSIKHSRAKGVSISFFTKRRKAFVLLLDNGQGFDINKNDTGNGMSNMIWRLEAMQSNYCFESNSDGTALFIEL